MFVASIVKIRTFNKDVLDSEWTLTSRAVRLVCTWQQISACVHRVWPILSLLMTASSRRDRDDFCWWPLTVGLIACNLFPVQLFQNCCHFSEINIVTQGTRSAAGIFMGWHRDRGQTSLPCPLFHYQKYPHDLGSSTELLFYHFMRV